MTTFNELFEAFQDEAVEYVDQLIAGHFPSDSKEALQPAADARQRYLAALYETGQP